MRLEYYDEPTVNVAVAVRDLFLVKSPVAWRTAAARAILERSPEKQVLIGPESLAAAFGISIS